MLIAFEGPDNVGKTFGATKLSGSAPIYNVTEDTYKEAQELTRVEKGVAQCFDRVSWITHLAYKMALPGRQWEDFPDYSVFAMPDTHLVFKLHRQGYAPEEDLEEGYAKGEPAIINNAYAHLAEMILIMNENQDFNLFKTVTILDVHTSPLGTTPKMEITEFSSPLHPWWGTPRTKLVRDDLSLFDLLLVEEANR